MRALLNPFHIAVIDYQKCDASATEWKIFSLMVFFFVPRDDGAAILDTRRPAALSLSAFDEFNNENSPPPVRHQSTQIMTSTRNRKNASDHDQAMAMANATAFNRTGRRWRRRKGKANEKRKEERKKYEEFRLGMRERRWRCRSRHYNAFHSFH